MCRSGGTVDTEDLKSSGRWLCRFKSGLRYQDRKKSPAGVRAAGAFFGSSVVVLFRLAFFPAILAFPAGKLFPQFGDAPALEKQEALPALQILSEPGVFAGEICPAVFTAQILSGENEAGTGTIERRKKRGMSFPARSGKPRGKGAIAHAKFLRGPEL